MKKHGWRGYITSRSHYGRFIPQRIQNAWIRQYCDKNNFEFYLSATEYYMDDCYMMLRSLLQNEVLEREGIIFFSLDLMPEDKEFRKEIYQRIFQTQSQLHFALEELQIKSQKDISLLEETLITKSILNSKEDPGLLYNA